MKSFLLRLAACLFVVVSSSSHAALYDRGNGLIYDDFLDITWMQDANYAHTSGYAAANAFSSPFGASSIQADGRMGWDAAITWADQLSYGGFDDWRLPKAEIRPPNPNRPPVSGFNVITSELGVMFYGNLDNGRYDTILNNVSFTDATPGGGTESFLNVQSHVYWSGEEHHIYSYSAWNFVTEFGLQGVSGKDGLSYSWAVRDGDVSTVPVPAAAWLFGSALAGLLVGRRKNKK